MIGRFFMVILFVCVVYLWIDMIESEASEVSDMYRSKIGSRVIINKDTLTVVNYSSIMETFTLSNGSVVDKSVILNKSK